MAIGDGANDVNMINAAHIGVGILGLEGSQAACASDYAIGQFRFLKNLLFVHGRENYRRNSQAIGYIFYKNIAEMVPLWAFGFYSLFSGTFLYDPSLVSLYNVAFTAAPVIWYAVFDKEYEKKVLLTRPHLYRIGLENKYFSFWQFIRWFMYASVQSSLMLVVLLMTLGNSPNDDGQIGDIY